MHHMLALIPDAVGVFDAVPAVRLRRPPANVSDHFVIETGAFSCSPGDLEWRCLQRFVESHSLSAENDDFPCEIRDSVVRRGSSSRYRAVFPVKSDEVFVLTVRAPMCHPEWEAPIAVQLAWWSHKGMRDEPGSTNKPRHLLPLRGPVFKQTRPRWKIRNNQGHPAGKSFFPACGTMDA